MLTSKVASFFVIGRDVVFEAKPRSVYEIAIEALIHGFLSVSMDASFMNTKIALFVRCVHARDLIATVHDRLCM